MRLGRLPTISHNARSEASEHAFGDRATEKGKVVGLYICTMRRYAPSQYRQVLLRAPTAALYCISSPTTASTFALACCDDFCQRRAKLYLTYCKRAFGKPQSGKSAQQARANAYFFRRSVASRGNSSAGPHTSTSALRRPLNTLRRPSNKGTSARYV